MKKTLGVFCAVCLLAAIPAQAAPILYYAALSGPNEAPPNASPGTGEAWVTFDADTNELRVQVNFSGLTSGVTASHIHCCTTVPFTGTAGVATAIPTFPGFPSGVTSGTYDQTFNTEDAGTYNPAFVTANGGTAAGAEARLALGLDEGRAYLNIHTTNFPAGEIRGFLQPVPEPATLGLLGLGLAGVIAKRRRRS